MRPLRLLATGVVAASLAGCISLFPKEQPVQLYRFGGPPAPAPQPGAQAAPVPVQALAIGFERAAATDRILTVAGDEAAYIRSARWVTAAPALFQAALNQAFDADPGPARLVAVGEAIRPSYFLKIDVRAFEARYDHGANAAPTIVVEVYAVLSHPADRSLVGEQTFRAAIPAAENRAGAIAIAFGEAVSKDLTALTAWVDAKAAG